MADIGSVALANTRWIFGGPVRRKSIGNCIPFHPTCRFTIFLNGNSLPESNYGLDYCDRTLDGGSFEIISRYGVISRNIQRYIRISADISLDIILIPREYTESFCTINRWKAGVVARGRVDS